VDGPVNLFSLLNQAATRFADRGAVYHGHRRFCSFRELREHALRLAGALRQHCPAGARIAIVSENRPEIVELLFGIWAAECTVVPVNYKLHPREVAEILDDASAYLVFASAAIATELASLTTVPIEALGGKGYVQRLTADPVAAPSTDPATLAWLFYTSGTTGRAKGAMLTHRNLMTMTVAHLADIDAPNEDCSLVHAAPMSHGSGLYIAAYVLRGARQVVPASTGFDADEFLELCEFHPGCSAFLAPTMVQRVVETGRARPRQLRTIIYGGGPMYVESMKNALAAFGPVFAQIYG
jgi:fatty-acyl-CoA synthase